METKLTQYVKKTFSEPNKEAKRGTSNWEFGLEVGRSEMKLGGGKGNYHEGRNENRGK